MASAGDIELIMTEIFNGCTMTDTLEVTIVPLPVLTFVLPPNICEEDPALDLIKTVTPKTGTFSGLGVTGTTFNPGTPGLNLNAQNTITYDYSDANNCKNDIPDSIEVVENPNVNITIDEPNICVGETTQLSVVNPNATYTYTWSPTGQVDATITTGSKGDYNVLVNFNGCVVKSNTVSLNTHSVSVDAGGPYFVKETECVYVSPNYAGAPTSYLWTDLSNGGIIGGSASENICISVGGPDTMYYSIDVQDNFGCTANDNFEIIVRRSIQVPEIITPNLDGLNDTWVIRNIEGYPKSLTKVYNRWGNMVFEAVGYLNDWDGTRNGEVLPVATYYYVIELNVKEEDKPYSGSLTIMR
jgi:gliding motility-associated-like protein